MKIIFKAALLLMLLCAAASARRRPPSARMIDSFGEVMITDLKARLDDFALELQDAPDAKGLVVVYAERHRFPGWAVRRAEASLDFLTHKLGAARASLINGGLRGETRFELWLVPAGADEPPVKPFDLSLLMSGAKTPLPFDRFDVVERGDTPLKEDDEYYPDARWLYDYLAEVLRADPGLRACVIAYTSRRGARAADRRIAASAKAAVVKSQAVDVRRVVAIGGGRRRYKAVEVWLAPPPNRRRTRFPHDAGGADVHSRRSRPPPSRRLPFAPSWCIIPAVFPVKINLRNRSSKP